MRRRSVSCRAGGSGARSGGCAKLGEVGGCEKSAKNEGCQHLAQSRAGIAGGMQRAPPLLPAPLSSPRLQQTQTGRQIDRRGRPPLPPLPLHKRAAPGPPPKRSQLPSDHSSRSGERGSACKGSGVAATFPPAPRRKVLARSASPAPAALPFPSRHAVEWAAERMRPQRQVQRCREGWGASSVVRRAAAPSGGVAAIQLWFQHTGFYRRCRRKTNPGGGWCVADATR